MLIIINYFQRKIIVLPIGLNIITLFFLQLVPLSGVLARLLDL